MNMSQEQDTFLNWKISKSKDDNQVRKLDHTVDDRHADPDDS